MEYNLDRNEKFGDILQYLQDLTNKVRGRGDRLSQNAYAMKILSISSSRLSNWKTGRSLPDDEGLKDLTKRLSAEYNREIYSSTTANLLYLAEEYKEYGYGSDFIAQFGVGTWAIKVIYKILGKPEPIPDDEKLQRIVTTYNAANSQDREILWQAFLIAAEKIVQQRKSTSA